MCFPRKLCISGDISRQFPELHGLVQTSADGTMRHCNAARSQSFGDKPVYEMLNVSARQRCQFSRAKLGS